MTLRDTNASHVRRTVHDVWRFAFGLLAAAGFDALGAPWWWIAGLGAALLIGGAKLLLRSGG